MFLKSIEIKGFKSFADKTEILFKKGITAIVGPNGSGKSNISDAVRWVLGEQSVKNLRGGKMEDVIFAGTQYRKAIGFAEVSLTLDNTDNQLSVDFSLINVKRRLYRSGESEYFINNTKCRLKDIQELFMDTGIGKEGYSLISQGKIDAILSGKADERRGLLEEAAGIVKFKSRKEEAQKRLINTEDNLTRINDIIGTYEERIEPLKIERDKAREFIALSDSLKNKELSLIIDSLEKLQIKYNSINDKFKKINDNNQLLIKEEISIKDKFKERTSILEQCENFIQNKKKDYFEDKTSHQEIISNINLFNEKIENLYNNITKNDSEIKDIMDELNKLDEEKSKLEKVIFDFQKEQDDIKNSLVGYENEFLTVNNEIIELTKLVKDMKNDQIDLLSEISNLKNNINILENEKDRNKSSLESLLKSHDDYETSIRINENTQKEIVAEIEEINKSIGEINNKIEDNIYKIEENNKELYKQEKLYQNYNSSFNKYEANYNMLLNLEKHYEGYNKTVKDLMNDIKGGSLSNFEKSSYVLGEIISVEKTLEIAIETALGGAISNIITDNEKIATKLVEYLKINKIGRATFLPLNILKSKEIVAINNIAKIKGYIGIASELVNYEEKFKNAINFVLGRTIICDNMNSALNIAKNTNYSYKVVTLSGDVLNPGGAITGGSYKFKGQNLLGRKREIGELENKIVKVKENLININNNIVMLKDYIKNIENKNNSLNKELQEKNIDRIKLGEKVIVLNDEYEKLLKNLKSSKEHIESLKSITKINESDIFIQNNNLKDLVLVKDKNEERITAIEEEIDIKSEIISNSREKSTSLKIKKAQLEEIILSKIRELERLAKDYEGFILKKEYIEKEKKECVNKINEYKQLVEKNNSEVKKIKDNINVLEKLLEEKEVEKIRLKEELNNISDRMESIKIEISSGESEIHKHEITLTKLEVEKEALYNKLNEEYNYTYAEALKYKCDISNVEEIKNEIASLKKQISLLGTVNLLAIEEYKEVYEKYNFMISQRKDLIYAKEELESVIEEMTQKMRSLFKDNFKILKEYFNEIFRELFKGGSADIYLTGGDELTANIDISVQPPGKKLQNINLMSGGEKVLSAIALLFAILKMRPTPFCILDEIEAALDDANIVRYAEFLRHFSKNIQFIVITHRKGTMEICDVLYGVTMEEKGISKIVSLDMKIINE